MKTLLLWLVPPAVGAVIGYVTNAVAIKMLFRPLQEVRLGKWRLPFTPGILPRRRKDLAQSIGRMVEQELLTPQIVRARLAREDVRAGVKDGVAAFTGRLLSTRIGDISLDKTDPVIGEALKSFLQSPAFASLLDEIPDFIAEKFEKIDENEFFRKTIREILGDEKTDALEKGLGSAVSAYITAHGSAVSEQITVIFANHFSQLADSCIAFLERGDIRFELEAQGRVFLSNALRKLSATQRFFLSLGQYDERLSERMPEIIDDLIRQLYTLLNDSGTRQRILALFADNTGRLLSNSGAQAANITAGLVSAQTDKPLAEVLRHIKKEDVRAVGQKILARAQTSPGSTSLFADFLQKMLAKREDAALAELFPLTAAQKDALDGFIAGKLLTLADEQIAAALASINVRALVADRIDELDMLQVERLILDIMANQLKWINVFGAILGAFIGVFQALFSWLLG